MSPLTHCGLLSAWLSVRGSAAKASACTWVAISILQLRYSRVYEYWLLGSLVESSVERLAGSILWSFQDGGQGRCRRVV